MKKKFKVGDWVECVKDAAFVGSFSSVHRKGKVYQIKENEELYYNLCQEDYKKVNNKPLTKKEKRAMEFGARAAEICLNHVLRARIGALNLDEFLSLRLTELFMKMERK